VLDDVGQSDWQSVSVGGDHTCALKLSGDVYCWGSNLYFQLGQANGDTVCGPDSAHYSCMRTPHLVQANGVKFTDVGSRRLLLGRQ
jgi:alpha-tubulin suppressor-like RCC1 family protein